ncbi:hypothetical protein DLJ49_05135 [Rhodovulum sp. 12E13]|uniref:DUF6931 family protein n=1 Tax=Rhodovulum sp. 12E13 TaxID=2203891 RepID=UPI000E11B2E9|nr:hypothetical protein [Rhodovulum sp. 12E13]RDC74061.1 hypothetical protein DLJ49_05135 [Rhodovulum sp. 12E13]
MSGRFDNMTKAAKEPAAKLLSLANLDLESPVDAPPTAPVDVVLAGLEQRGAVIDQLKLMAVALPPRERVWWACLAARDMVGSGDARMTPALKAAEAWVVRPTDENREAARASLDHARVDDDTVLCAEAVLYADGTLGPGDLAEHPAPAGACEVLAFVMNLKAMGEHEGDPMAYGRVLVDRAVDIARGGNGRIAAPRGASEEV